MTCFAPRAAGPYLFHFSGRFGKSPKRRCEMSVWNVAERSPESRRQVAGKSPASRRKVAEKGAPARVGPLGKPTSRQAPSNRGQIVWIGQQEVEKKAV